MASPARSSRGIRRALWGSPRAHRALCGQAPPAFLWAVVTRLRPTIPAGMPRVEGIRAIRRAQRAPRWASALASASALLSSHISKPLGGVLLALRRLPTTLALALAFGLAY